MSEFDRPLKTVSSPRFKPSKHPVLFAYWKKTNDRPVVWTLYSRVPEPPPNWEPQDPNYLQSTKEPPWWLSEKRNTHAFHVDPNRDE